MSVNDYRLWLTQQMALIKNFSSTDELDFNS